MSALSRYIRGCKLSKSERKVGVADQAAHKNEQDPSIRRLATLADVETAIPEASQSGSFFFADIQNNQVDATGQAILRFIAAQGEGAFEY